MQLNETLLVFASNWNEYVVIYVIFYGSFSMLLVNCMHIPNFRQKLYNKEKITHSLTKNILPAIFSQSRYCITLIWSRYVSFVQPRIRNIKNILTIFYRKYSFVHLNDSSYFYYIWYTFKSFQPLTIMYRNYFACLFIWTKYPMFEVFTGNILQ